MKPEAVESGLAPTDFIPHRPPILGVDRILALGAESAVTEGRVGPGPDVGPDGELWEGALIEGLAQTASALHTAGARRGGRRIARGMLVGLQRLVIHRRPRLGERVEYRIELLRQLEAVSLVRGSVLVGGEVLAEGELKFYVEGEA